MLETQLFLITVQYIIYVTGTIVLNNNTVYNNYMYRHGLFSITVQYIIYVRDTIVLINSTVYHICYRHNCSE